MNLILNNPYRIVGLLVGATAREQTKQINTLKRHLEVDQDQKDDFSFTVLGEFHRTIENVEAAASKLNLDNDKINAALFWFWNGNSITDEAAFDALKSADIEAAHEIWDKLITQTDDKGKRFWKPITEKNYSAFHNHSVLNIIRSNGNLHNAVIASLRFLESDLIQKFVSSIADETHKTNKKELQLSFLNQLHSDLEVNKSSILPKFIEILNKQEFIAKKDFINGIIQKPIEQIEYKIETSRNKRKISKANAAKAGQELYIAVSSDLTQLRNIVGASDLNYISISDKVANEILQCSIDYFNDSQEKESSVDYTEIAMKLAKQAEILAAGVRTKNSIKDSIDTLEEMKDKELSQAIQLLQAVKNAYESNERDITEEVFRLVKTDLQIKLGRKVINWSAVTDNIRNTINWEEVNKQLIPILSDNNLKKIKESDKCEQKKEFLELASWLIEKSKMPSVISTIIDKYKKIAPKLPFKIISCEVTNTDKKPLYTKFIRYIGLAMTIEVTESRSVDFYVKYIKPNGSVDRDQKNSPTGYTLLDTKDLDLSTKSIYLSGWGNPDKCTYQIGKHRLEVYFEDYLIQSIDFKVDIAPSEKLKVELKKAEVRLSEIRNSKFFMPELEMANNALIEIQKFKWFRISYTKRLQIKEQEQIISNINQKAENKMKQLLEKQYELIEKLKINLQKAEY